MNQDLENKLIIYKHRLQIYPKTKKEYREIKEIIKTFSHSDCGEYILCEGIEIHKPY